MTPYLFEKYFGNSDLERLFLWNVAREKIPVEQ